MQKEISSLTRKYFKIIAGGILTTMGAGLVTVVASIFTDITQLKAQVATYKDDRIYNEKRFDENKKEFGEIHQMIKEIHYFLIEKKDR